MNYDALIDFIADKLNEKINLPFLNEAQEKRLITFVLSLAFEFLLKFLDNESQKQIDLDL